MNYFIRMCSVTAGPIISLYQFMLGYQAYLENNQSSAAQSQLQTAFLTNFFATNLAMFPLVQYNHAVLSRYYGGQSALDRVYNPRAIHYWLCFISFIILTPALKRGLIPSGAIGLKSWQPSSTLIGLYSLQMAYSVFSIITQLDHVRYTMLHDNTAMSPAQNTARKRGLSLHQAVYRFSLIFLIATPFLLIGFDHKNNVTPEFKEKVLFHLIQLASAALFFRFYFNPKTEGFIGLFRLPPENRTFACLRAIVNLGTLPFIIIYFYNSHAQHLANKALSHACLAMLGIAHFLHGVQIIRQAHNWQAGAFGQPQQPLQQPLLPNAAPHPHT